MKKFLRFQLELIGTDEKRDLNQAVVEKLNEDYKKKVGIYNPLFGEETEVAAHVTNNTLILCGSITAETKQGCKGAYAEFKAIAKKTFPTCTKTLDLLVAQGDTLH
jgi:hypothetical protein